MIDAMLKNRAFIFACADFACQKKNYFLFFLNATKKFLINFMTSGGTIKPFMTHACHY
jgi:hypothetical protein